jgi:hypothetical protein
MQDAPEQAQAAPAPETVAADTAAALETSAPVVATEQEPKSPITLAELDALANDVLATQKADPPKPAEPPKEEPTPEKAEPEEEVKKTADRVRLTNLKDADKALVTNAVQMVKDGQAASIAEAVNKILGIPATAPATATEAAAAPAPEPTPDPHAATIDSMKEQITETLKSLTAAKKDFNDELETELTDKLLDLKSDMKLLQYRREQEAAAAEKQEADQLASSYEVYYQDYKTQAESLYPDASVPGTPLFEQIQQDVAWFEKNNPAIFNSPNYPLLIAGSAAAKIGKAPIFSQEAAAQEAPPATQSPNAKVAARPANPLVGGNATTVSSDIKSAARQVEAIRSIHDLDALAEATFQSR